MLTHGKWIVLVLAAVTLSASATFAQYGAPATGSPAQVQPSPSTTQTQSPPGMVARGDKRFLEKVARANQSEIELGRLAAEHAASDAVKQFGDRMVKDHSQASDEVKQLAQQKGVALPQTLDRSHTKAVERLSKLTGAAFDRAFVNDMVKDHQKAVSDFRHEAQRAKDPDVKQWANKTLPTLEDHLRAAQGLQATVGAKS